MWKNLLPCVILWFLLPSNIDELVENNKVIGIRNLATDKIPIMWDAVESKVPFKGTPPFQNCWVKNCRVENDDGGYVLAYIYSAKKIAKTKDTVVFSKNCFSACTGLAELVKDNACIAKDIIFAFHADSTGRVPNWYSKWTLDWIILHGGLPDFKSGKFLLMSFDEAKNHWRPCTNKELESIH